MPEHQGSRSFDLWDLADLVTPMAVRVAATYRVADHITAGRSTARAIAGAERLHPGALDRMLRHLVTVGLLTRRGQSYALTARGQALRSDHPDGQRALIDLNGAIGRGDLGFVELAHVVRTGEAAYPIRYGIPYWDDLATDRELAESFDEAMADNVARDAREIAYALDWSVLGHVVDVGGGNGALLSHLLTAHPGLVGTVFDLPGTVERARRTLAAAGLAARSDVVAGSFFDELPAGAGGYLLSSILHDWDDGRAVAILARCAEAAGEHGRIFVIEETGKEGEPVNTGMDVRLLAYVGGRERDLAQNIELAAAAGLSVARVRQVSGQSAARSVIELVPAGPDPDRQR
ncbi:methyltransferase [Streptomyces sp. NPDC046557]|uniref:methyltransferase n=1 Tax=Streptomyces sp. NPDC046557 TaxID=3155372 RepID=UPI003411DAFB